MSNDQNRCFLIKPKNSFNLPTQYLTEEFNKYKRKKKIVNQQYNQLSFWKRQPNFPLKEYRLTGITITDYKHPKKYLNDNNKEIDYFTEVAVATSPNSLNIKKLIDIMKIKDKPKDDLQLPQTNTICKRSYSTQGHRMNKSEIGGTMKKMIEKRRGDVTFSYLLQEKKY